MQSNEWLLLTDYASKYRVSVSTLRRRIKAGHLQHRFEGGKYFVRDAPLESREHTPHFAETLTFPGIRPVPTEAAPLTKKPEFKLQELPIEEPVSATTTRLLNELKRAYMSILHEKEEQIIQLKEEVTDLKTLVRVLEDDNDRMRRFVSQKSPQP